MSEHEEFMPANAHNSTNDHIDKLTLELLLNKNHYSKYLSQTDPEKYEKHKVFKSKLRKYSVDIIDITSQMIENPKDAPSKDIEESFDLYVKSILRYFEMKDLENANEYNHETPEDEDLLFGTMEQQQNDVTPSKSFWGKERVLKKEKDINAFTLEMFSRPKR